MKLAEVVSAQVTPDIRAGDTMDIRDVIKIKRIPGGTALDTEIVGGIVCTKNVVHRKMCTDIANPRILLLNCSLEYGIAC